MGIAPPPDWSDGELPTAVICRDIRNSYIAPELALAYGCNSLPGVIEICIRQLSHDTLRVHQFDPIAINFRAAHPRLGPNYLGIGWDVMEEYFDIDPHLAKPDDPSPDFLFLAPWSEFADRCHEL